MNILVSDTSVLIDLERGQCLDSCFSLPHKFAVPDLLYKRELADFGGPELLRRGLLVETLTGSEVAISQDVRAKRPRLSVPDAYSYTLARERGWTLLTGDGELRELARANDLAHHGVLWVLDQMHAAASMAPAALATALEAIAGHPRCRLPQAEVQARLTRYRTNT